MLDCQKTQQIVGVKLTIGWCWFSGDRWERLLEEGKETCSRQSDYQWVLGMGVTHNSYLLELLPCIFIGRWWTGRQTSWPSWLHPFYNKHMYIVTVKENDRIVSEWKHLQNADWCVNSVNIRSCAMRLSNRCAFAFSDQCFNPSTSHLPRVARVMVNDLLFAPSVCCSSWGFMLLGPWPRTVSRVPEIVLYWLWWWIVWNASLSHSPFFTSSSIACHIQSQISVESIYKKFLVMFLTPLIYHVQLWIIDLENLLEVGNKCYCFLSFQIGL